MADDRESNAPYAAASALPASLMKKTAETTPTQRTNRLTSDHLGNHNDDFTAQEFRTSRYHEESEAPESLGKAKLGAKKDAWFASVRSAVSPALPTSRYSPAPGFGKPKNVLVRFIPSIQWLGHYNVRENWKGDLVAGLSVGLMIVPQGLAHAIIMGVPVQYGLYTAIFPLILYALLGTSRQISFATSNVNAFLVFTVLGSETDQTIRAHNAIYLSFITGLTLLLLGVLRLGFIVNLLSRPVMNGYITAAAILIVFEQIRNVFGITYQRTNYLSLSIYRLFSNVGGLQWATTLIGFSSLAILIGMKQMKKYFAKKVAATEAEHSRLESETESEISAAVLESGEIEASTNSVLARQKQLKRRASIFQMAKFAMSFGAVVVVIIGSTCAYIAVKRGQKVAIIGDAPSGLPTPVFPPSIAESDQLLNLLPGGIAIALISYGSSYALAKRIALRENYEIDANQELLAMGLGSFVGSFFQSMPPMGSLSRTVVNYENNKTQVSSLISAVVIILAVSCIMDTLYYLPRASLAAIIIVAAFTLIDFKTPRWFWKVNKIDFGVWFVSFAITANVDLMWGLVSSIGASLIGLAIQNLGTPVTLLGVATTTVAPTKVAQDEGEAFLGDNSRQDHARVLAPLGHPGVEEMDGVLIVRIDTSLYFANVTKLENWLNAFPMYATHSGNGLRALVLDFSRVNTLDASGVAALETVVSVYRSNNINNIVFINTNPHVTRTLRYAELDIVFGEDIVPASSSDGISTEESVKRLLTAGSA